jgi:hypothetical protein
MTTSGTQNTSMSLYMLSFCASEVDVVHSIHMGRGRKLIDPSPKFHISVKQRMEDRSLNYTPKAKWTPGTETYVD